jgi:hypothetical protein
LHGISFFYAGTNVDILGIPVQIEIKLVGWGGGDPLEFVIAWRAQS